MIEVIREPGPPIPEAHEVMEKCCFCRRPTRYWYTPKDVAVCQGCAKVAKPEDVPDKKLWGRREEIAWHSMPDRDENGSVAQQAERVAVNHQAAGSTPAAPATR